MADEHRCGDGTCILMEYLCDNRPDCRDMSDEVNCGESLLRLPAVTRSRRHGWVGHVLAQEPAALTLANHRCKLESRSASSPHNPAHHNHPC